MKPISVDKHSEKIFSLIKGAYQGLESNTNVMFYPTWDSDRELKRGFGVDQSDAHEMASTYRGIPIVEPYVFYTMDDADYCREVGRMYFGFSDLTAAKLLIDQLNWCIAWDQALYTVEWEGSEETRVLLRPLKKGEVCKPWVPKGA